MLVFSDLSLRRGSKELVTNANASIHVGHKVGLTGANGTGKSSLFALIQRELSPDHGDVTLPDGWVIAHVKQETPATDSTILDYALQGDKEYAELKQQIDQASDTKLALLLGQFEAIDGYTAESRAARLLAGLGFAAADMTRSVNTFSGGWRMRLNLAQALMCRSDLLLLDEPTNHLDMETVVWLQSWLQSYQGTLLVISHDREFLDAITTHIAHIEQGGLKLYKGNYSGFEKVRAEHLMQQQANYARQQKEVAHMESFITRFKAKASKAKQAQSRIKSLERMQMIAPVLANSEFNFSFKEPDKLPDRLFHADKLALGYGDGEDILQNVRLQVMPQDRIGLVGPNGAGKSTLIKYMADELEARGGETWRAQYLKIGYFAQHQLDQLIGDNSPLQHLRELDKQEREQTLRNYLGGFGFHGDRVDAKVSIFSGGEKSRLVLALLVYQKPNLLLLDEPTNHLDIEMRQALAMALQDFAGAMVVVSHDRFLLKTVADTLLVVDNGEVNEFEGDLDEYSRWSLKQRNQSNDEAAPSQSNTKQDTTSHSSTGLSAKEQRKQQAERRKQLQPLKKVVDKLEQQMEKLSNKQGTLEASLAEPEIYQDDAKDKLKALLEEKRQIDAELESIEAEWLEASEAYEMANDELD